MAESLQHMEHTQVQDLLIRVVHRNAKALGELCHTARGSGHEVRLSCHESDNQYYFKIVELRKKIGPIQMEEEEAKVLQDYRANSGPIIIDREIIDFCVLENYAPGKPASPIKPQEPTAKKSTKAEMAKHISELTLKLNTMICKNQELQDKLEESKKAARVSAVTTPNPETERQQTDRRTDRLDNRPATPDDDAESTGQLASPRLPRAFNTRTFSNNNNNFEEEELRCFRCDFPGHMREQCTAPEGWKRCFNCEQLANHLARNCPYPKRAQTTRHMYRRQHRH